MYIMYICIYMYACLCVCVRVCVCVCVCVCAHQTHWCTCMSLLISGSHPPSAPGPP